MKHILIIISILLLSSPVIGDNHKGETLYRWETSSGGEVWKGFGYNETHLKYIGKVKNGKPNDLGVLFYTKGVKYIGEWKNGEFIEGTMTKPDGSFYAGEYKDGIPNGKGTHTFGKGDFEGDKYEGEYKGGIPNGQGTYTSSNGEKYEGEWKDEKPWNGTYYDKDGNIKGKFVNGKEIHQ